MLFFWWGPGQLRRVFGLSLLFNLMLYCRSWPGQLRWDGPGGARLQGAAHHGRHLAPGCQPVSECLCRLPGMPGGRPLAPIFAKLNICGGRGCSDVAMCKVPDNVIGRVCLVMVRILCQVFSIASSVVNPDPRGQKLPTKVDKSL